VSDGYFSNDDSIRTDPDTVFEGGCAGARASAGSADGDSLRDVDIGAESCVGTNDDSPEVADIQPRSDVGCGRDIEAIPESAAVELKPVIEVGEDAQSFFSLAVEGDLAEIVGKTEAWFVKVG